MPKRRSRQIRRYLVVLEPGALPQLRGPFMTEAARQKVGDGIRYPCLVLDVPFHRGVHVEDRRPLVDEFMQSKKKPRSSILPSAKGLRA